MTEIQKLTGGSLPEAPATPGIKRYLAFEGEGCLVVRSHADPGTVSA
jgi:hypothetical protein